MEKVTLNLPSMYADHHVIEVRRILSEVAGVDDIYASSSFHVVEVTFDPTQTDVDAITAVLEQAGYSDTPAIPIEQKISPTDDNADTRFFRHTAAYQQVGNTVSFAQRISYTGRPLWPCPGMGVIQVEAIKENMADG